MKLPLHLQRAAQRAARILKLGGTPKVEVFKYRRGRAHAHAGRCYIPQWALRKNPSYALYYLLHELAHFAPVTSRYKPGQVLGWSCRPHGREFQRIEWELCDAFGLRLWIQRGNYPAQIRCAATGKVLCGKKGAPVSGQEDYDPACLI